VLFSFDCTVDLGDAAYAHDTTVIFFLQWETLLISRKIHRVIHHDTTVHDNKLWF